MNCRPGDLAIVIKSTFGESVGKIVSVVAVEPSGIAEWLVEIPRNPGPLAGLWACHDSWLHPICGRIAGRRLPRCLKCRTSKPVIGSSAMI